ncbi:hypothetical protein [Nocardioides campestrisoli]|uniref:hypothetical protein n=1 Tax=Nocardioides campestrisoli TaxID=2736757 RepID=UPI0015E7805A|nr:hypothetical protein [Nocardioides campestrisoli]
MTEHPIDPDGERLVPPETELDDSDLPPTAEDEVLDDLLGADAPPTPVEDPDGASLVDTEPDRLAGNPDDSSPDPAEDA